MQVAGEKLLHSNSEIQAWLHGTAGSASACEIRFCAVFYLLHANTAEKTSLKNSQSHPGRDSQHRTPPFFLEIDGAQRRSPQNADNSPPPPLPPFTGTLVHIFVEVHWLSPFQSPFNPWVCVLSGSLQRGYYSGPYYCAPRGLSPSWWQSFQASP